MNELIVVKQLPIIEEQLRKVKAEIEEKTDKALKMVCTEETVKAVKKVRAELNKDFEALEEQRKQVKAQIMNPYEQFEAIYRECVSEPFRSADKILKSNIDSTENELKETKKRAVFDYFYEYSKSLGIDFVNFEQMGINVTMSASEKSLKEKVKVFLDKVENDLGVISSLEYADQVLVEYKYTLNLSYSMNRVKERMQALEAERAKKKALEEKRKQEKAAAEKVEEVLKEETIAPPKVSEAETHEERTETQENTQEPQYQVTFTVTSDISKLKALKQFLTDGGYHYESK